MAEALLEAVLGDIARTKAVGLLSRYPTLELPLHYFEPLGSFSFFPPKGPPLSITAYFRQLQEDTGSLGLVPSRTHAISSTRISKKDPAQGNADGL